jgi:riboflavin synthase
VFSGIILATGTVVERRELNDGARLVLRVPEALRGLEPGASLAVNGTCLTVVERAGDTLAFDAVGATLERTLLGGIAPGDRVNLEPSLRAGDPLDGHIVTGHVDGMGTVTEVRPGDGAVWFTFEMPEPLRAQVALRGSVAVDGVSLTIAGVTPTGFTVSIVPYTLEHTLFGEYETGRRVHLETDVLAKYVERALAGARGTES